MNNGKHAKLYPLTLSPSKGERSWFDKLTICHCPFFISHFSLAPASCPLSMVQFSFDNHTRV